MAKDIREGEILEASFFSLCWQGLPHTSQSLFLVIASRKVKQRGGMYPLHDRGDLCSGRELRRDGQCHAKFSSIRQALLWLIEDKYSIHFQRSNEVKNYQLANLTSVGGNVREQILAEVISSYMKNKELFGNSFTMSKWRMTSWPAWLHSAVEVMGFGDKRRTVPDVIPLINLLPWQDLP